MTDHRREGSDAYPPVRYQGAHYDSSRWDGFEFRNDDIVICAPQKCGTTWVQMICALLIFQTDQLSGRLGELSPWLDSRTETLASVTATLNAQQHRRFIKTHTPLDGIPHREGVTYLCVGRDPRDVAVSAYHAWTNVNVGVAREAIRAIGGYDGLPDEWWQGTPFVFEGVVQFFWVFVYAPPPPANPVANLAGVTAHLRAAWERRRLPNVALFHYADLQADLEAEMRRVADFLSITVSEELWPQLVRAARFETMQAHANDLVPEVKVDGIWRDNRQFFHRGSGGEWREFMTAADSERYEARLDELGVTSDFRQWIHNGATPGVGQTTPQ